MSADIVQKLQSMTDEQVLAQRDTHRSQLNFGTEERQRLHVYMLGLCDSELYKRRKHPEQISR